MAHEHDQKRWGCDAAIGILLALLGAGSLSGCVDGGPHPEPPFMPPNGEGGNFSSDPDAGANAGTGAMSGGAGGAGGAGGVGGAGAGGMNAQAGVGVSGGSGGMEAQAGCDIEPIECDGGTPDDDDSGVIEDDAAITH